MYRSQQGGGRGGNWLRVSSLSYQSSLTNEREMNMKIVYEKRSIIKRCLIVARIKNTTHIPTTIVRWRWYNGKFEHIFDVIEKWTTSKSLYSMTDNDSGSDNNNNAAGRHHDRDGVIHTSNTSFSRLHRSIAQQQSTDRRNDNNKKRVSLSQQYTKIIRQQSWKKCVCKRWNGNIAGGMW